MKNSHCPLRPGLERIISDLHMLILVKENSYKCLFTSGVHKDEAG